MQDLRSLIIVHLVEKRAEGTIFARTRADWPLHVTLVPWFSVADDQRDALLSQLNHYATKKTPFSVHIGKEELFGVGMDIPVNLIAEQVPVASLHEELMAIVGRYGKQFRQNAGQFLSVQQNYRAHITHHQATDGAHRRYAGDEELFESITVGRLLDNHGVQVCEIIDNIELKGQGDEAAA